MGYQERAFSRGWRDVRMIYNILCRTRNFQVELSSEVITPRKGVQRPSTNGNPTVKKSVQIETFQLALCAEKVRSYRDERQIR